MRYAREHLDADNTAAISALVKAYYAATPAHTGLPPYDFNWNVYMTLQRQDMLLLVTARTEEEGLCGVGLYVLSEHPHHRGWVGAECDTLAVDHTMRGKGIGRGIVQYAEQVLKQHGVQFMVHKYRTCYQTEPLFPKLGFELAEHSYMKVL